MQICENLIFAKLAVLQIKKGLTEEWKKCEWVWVVGLSNRQSVVTGEHTCTWKKKVKTKCVPAKARVRAWKWLTRRESAPSFSRTCEALSGCCTVGAPGPTPTSNSSNSNGPGARRCWWHRRHRCETATRTGAASRLHRPRHRRLRLRRSWWARPRAWGHRHRRRLQEQGHPRKAKVITRNRLARSLILVRFKFQIRCKLTGLVTNLTSSFNERVTFLNDLFFFHRK